MPYIPDHLSILRSRIVSDPELRFTKGGNGKEPTAVCTFSVVSAKRVLNPTTQRHEDKARQFMRVTTWGYLAERAATLPKGLPVVLVGNLEPDNWKDREGNERTEWQFTVERLGLDLSLVDIADAGPGFVNITWRTAEQKRAQRTQPQPTGLEGQVGKSWDQSNF